FMQPLGEVLLRVPLRAPAANDAEAETYRVSLLSHERAFFLYSGTSTTTVTCDVRALIRLARPIDRAIQRFCTGPQSMNTLLTISLSESAFSFSVALAIAEPSTLDSMRAALRCCMRRIDMASSTERPRIMSATARTLRGDSRNR